MAEANAPPDPLKAIQASVPCPICHNSNIAIVGRVNTCRVCRNQFALEIKVTEHFVTRPLWQGAQAIPYKIERNDDAEENSVC